MMAVDQECLYNILKIPRDAAPDDVRQAYFEAARKYHPDVNANPEASELFLKIQDAYDVLSHKERRRRYDLSLQVDEPIAPDVKLELQYGRPELLNVSEPQLVYIIGDLRTTLDEAQVRRTPLNLNLTIDRSTSMNGPRLDMVKANINSLLKILQPDDILSVVAFSDKADVIVPPTRLGDDEKIRRKIAGISASGSTEIFQGLVAGISEAKRHLRPNYINHLILLTDGHTYGDEAACLRIGEECAELGIGISGVGIGADWNDEFLDRLSNLGGSSCHFLTGEDDLEIFLIAKLNLFKKIYAERVALDLELEDGVELRYAFQISPENGPITTGNRMHIGVISFGMPCRFALELLVKSTPKAGMSKRLVRGKIMMEVLSRKIPYAKLQFQSKLPVSGDPSQSLVNRDVLQDISHVMLYRMQERARSEIKDGDFTNGTRHLQSFATNLYSQGEQEFAHSVLREAEFIQGNRRYTEEGEKRIKYHTRALLTPPG
jgi:Ca-activated chloride channel family protein